MVHLFCLMASESLAGPLSLVISSRCGIFPPEVCDLYQGAEPIVVSANY